MAKKRLYKNVGLFEPTPTLIRVKILLIAVQVCQAVKLEGGYIFVKPFIRVNPSALCLKRGLQARRTVLVVLKNIKKFNFLKSRLKSRLNKH
jgi:hypothetical protein